MRPSADRNKNSIQTSHDPLEELRNELDQLQTAFDALWEEYEQIVATANISTPEITVETIQADYGTIQGMGAAIAKPYAPPRYVITIRDPDRKAVHRYDAHSYTLTHEI